MEHLASSFFRALRSLFAPGMFGIMILSVLITIVALIAFATSLSFVLAWFASFSANNFIATYLPWLGSIGAFMLAWLLFPGIMPIIVSFFDNRIASLIEQQDYPASKAAHEPPFWQELRHDIGFFFIVVVLNICALPLYLIPLINLLVFPLLNGYLLGREFFMMVAKRHKTIEGANDLRKKNSRIITFAGIALVICSIVPIANLFAPFWGIAVMSHLYHRLIGTPPSELLAPK